MANLMKQFVTDIAKKHLKINNVTIELAEGSLAKGHLSTLHRAEILGRKAGEVVKVSVAVKKAPANEGYDQEERFYKNILPQLRSYQSAKGVKKNTMPVPEFYGSRTAESTKMLAMEDLTKKGFEPTRRVTAIADEDHVMKILKEMGRIHGTSFSYRHQQPEEGDKQRDMFLMTEEEISEYQRPKQLTGHQFVARMTCTQIWSAVKGRVPSSEDQYEKEITSSPVFKACEEMLKRVSIYKGKHSCLIHGSAIMSNMMFKYQDEVPKEIRFVDWKRSTYGTPVYDLSYFLYTSAPTSMLREKSVQQCLKEYHQSLADTIKEHGCDPKQVIPFNVLQEDWKNYHHAGMIGSVLVFTNYITKGADLIAQMKKQINDESHIPDYVILPIEYAHADRIQRVEEALHNAKL